MAARLAYSTASGSATERPRYASTRAQRVDSILQAAFERGLTEDEIAVLARRYGFRMA